MNTPKTVNIRDLPDEELQEMLDRMDIQQFVYKSELSNAQQLLYSAIEEELNAREFNWYAMEDSQSAALGE